MINAERWGGACILPARSTLRSYRNEICCGADRKRHWQKAKAQPWSLQIHTASVQKILREVLMSNGWCFSSQEMHFAASALFFLPSAVCFLTASAKPSSSSASDYLLSTSTCQGATHVKQNFVVSPFLLLRYLIELIARLWTWLIGLNLWPGLFKTRITRVYPAWRVLQKGIGCQVSR